MVCVCACMCGDVSGTEGGDPSEAVRRHILAFAEVQTSDTIMENLGCVCERERVCMCVACVHLSIHANLA